MLTTRAPGYLMRVEPGELDLQRFERLVEEGETCASAAGRGGVGAASRGAGALARPGPRRVRVRGFAQAAIGRLEEIRLAALELRIDADLALGRHHELVGELEALVAEHPLRERLRRS